MCFGEGISLDGMECEMSSQPIEQESCNDHLCGDGQEGCENTAYGCCFDKITVATGPQQQGCGPRSVNVVFIKSIVYLQYIFMRLSTYYQYSFSSMK